MLNKKALWTFLILTFGLTIIISILVRLAGFSMTDLPTPMVQAAVGMAMFIPGLSAIFTQKVVAKKPLKELGFKLGPAAMYLKTYLLIVAVFVINFGLTALLLLKPDFSLNSFLNQFGGNLTLPIPAPLMVAALSVVTFIIAPIMNMIPSLGEEVGWRGFLLPALEPLGKLRAMVLSGMIWAAWHTPMIFILGFYYGRQAWPGALLHFGLVTGLGIWMGYVWLKTRSTILAAFIHSTFNANAYGIWSILFISSSKLLIGAAGIIGVSLCLLVGLVALYLARRDDLVGNKAVV